nr:nucleolin 2-like [Lolium perenne]
MARIRHLQNTRGKELSGVQITAYFLRIRVQPLQARKNPLWTYSGENDANRISSDLSVKDLEKLVRRISRLGKKDPIPSSCRVEPYSASNPLPENHPTMASLPPLPEDGEVEERAVVDDVNQETPSFVNEPADSRKSAGSTEKDAASEDTTSAQSPPPAVSPKSKRKRSNAEDSGTSKPEETAPAPRKAAYDPYIESIISSDDEETPTLDVAARTSTSHTLVISEKPVEGEESSPPQQNVDTSTPSSPRAPSPKRARVEKIVDPAPQLGSSSPPLLDDPMIKDLLRIGSQFIGYREYANRAEGNDFHTCRFSLICHSCYLPRFFDLSSLFFPYLDRETCRG